jgi:23S rRNA (cytidine1920-2'-O)/16S rRNA (cytidine1409-2'-O)-methyltransferase
MERIKKRRMAKPPKKRRLDQLLVDRGHFEDLKTAQGFIMSQRVVVGGEVADKAGQPVSADEEIIIRGAPDKYVSRGGEKLEAAIARFGIPIRDRVVLDAGASTGGFSDCLLQSGARRVYAVDVGYGQLRGKIATDPRVHSREKTNISDLSIEDFDPPIDLCTADLSYLSITKAAPILSKLFRGPAQMIMLIKPLYEGVPQEAKADPRELGAALDRILLALPASGLVITDLMVSPILGSRGAVEFLARIEPGTSRRDDDGLVKRVLEEIESEG